MARLLLVNGPPGIGKSTLARRYVQDHPLALCLDIDVIRGLLGRWDEQTTAAGLLARGLALRLADQHLGTGHDVVVPQFLGRVDLIEQLESLAREGGGATPSHPGGPDARRRAGPGLPGPARCCAVGLSRCSASSALYPQAASREVRVGPRYPVRPTTSSVLRSAAVAGDVKTVPRTVKYAAGRADGPGVRPGTRPVEVITLGETMQASQEPVAAQPDEAPLEPPAEHVKELLEDHVPLSLLMDLTVPEGPHSKEILDDEGAPAQAWWEPQS